MNTLDRRDLLKLAAAFAIPAAWAQQAAKPDWRPSFLDAHQNETVIALTELIIPATDTPGAKDAHVNRYVDLFLRDGDPVTREVFMSGLNLLDGQSIQQHGHPFVKLTSAQQMELIQTLDAHPGPGHDFLQRTKYMTSGIYYNTEVGYRELNKGGRVPKSFGCDHQAHG